MENLQFEHFDAFRSFFTAHAAADDAALDVESLRELYRKALYGPYDLTPADEVDVGSVASAIAVATGLAVKDVVVLSSSGLHPDQGMHGGSGDLVELLYRTVIGKDNAGRLSWHVSDRHGFASRRFLRQNVIDRLDLSIRDGGLGFRLPRSIRAGFGGALINRLNRSVDIDVGVENQLAELLIRSFCYAIRACLLPYLCYSLAGIDEGKYGLMPLIERLDSMLPLSELPGRPGTWLVLAA